VEHYELIRRKVLIDGLSQRDTAKELGHSRKTVAKALELRIPRGYCPPTRWTRGALHRQVQSQEVGEGPRGCEVACLEVP
jgi:transposase